MTRLRRGRGIAAVLLTTLVAVASARAFAAPAPEATGAAMPDGATASAAQEAEAAALELARGLDGLRLPGTPAPYHAELRIVRAELFTVEGAYGGLVTDVLDQQAVASVEVRVGSAARDNGNFYGADGDGLVRLELSLAPDPAFARRRLWLAMDAALRGASRAWAQKQGVLQRIALADDVPDLGAPPPAIVRVRGPGERAPLPREALGELVRAASEAFAQAPEVDAGAVVIQVVRSHELLVTSEGVRVDWARDRAVVAVTAELRADDGTLLDHGRALHLQGPLPAPEELAPQLRALVGRTITELQAHAQAPVLDEEYDGPVLLLPTAAAQLLASTVAVAAIGTPPPLSDGGRLLELEPPWQARVGADVLPPELDLVDDPTAPGFGRIELDAEGFVARRTPLVQGGRLVDLLMSRTPTAARRESNGHARMTPSLEVAPAITNLALTSRGRTLAPAALRSELLARARDDGYDAAYIIAEFRDAGLLGPLPRTGPDTLASGRKVELPIPAVVIRIGADGRTTTLRGAWLAPASLRVLRRIRAVGREREVVPLRLPVGIYGGFAAALGVDGVLSQTVDTSVSAPALILEGLELLPERGEVDRPPTLTHPLRRDAREPAAPRGPADAAAPAP